MFLPSGRCRARTDDLLVVSQSTVILERKPYVRICRICAVHKGVTATLAKRCRTGPDAFGHKSWVKSWVAEPPVSSRR